MMLLTHSTLKKSKGENLSKFIICKTCAIKSEEELLFIWPALLRHSPIKEDKHIGTYNKNKNKENSSYNNIKSMDKDVEIRSILTESNNNNNNASTSTTTTTTTTTPLSLQSPKDHQLHQNQQISSPTFPRKIVDPKSVSPQAIPLSSVTSNSSRTTIRSRNVSGGTTEERLTSLPEKRLLPWREGVDPGAENETGGESRRKQIRFGCLLATRGEIQAVPCNSCINGRGKFSVCISLPNFFKGACASCQLSGRPNRCSIKKTEDIQENPNIIRVLHSSQAENVENTSSTHYESNSNHSKRRKVIETKIIDDNPAWDDPQRQERQEFDDGSLSQSNTVSQQWATVNRQAPNQLTKPPMNSKSENISTSENNFMKTSMQSGFLKNHSSIARISHGKEANGYITQQDASIEGSKASNERVEKIVLIDTLPKAKQRQVYGLMSGIQGGIDHLQRELNSLRNALGIDDKD